jgi:dienelactone hydrolase
MFHSVHRRAVAVGGLLWGNAVGLLPAQGTGPGLVVPVPSTTAVTVRSDSFTGSDGARRQLDVYRPANATGAVPVAVFANGAGPALRGWRSYIEWARLVTGRGLAGVLYDGPTWDTLKSSEENLRGSIADLDSVLAALARDESVLGVNGSNVVLWAGSAQTFTATPVALGGARPAVRGYVLYYGGGRVAEPRLDVPVLMVKAGQDAPGLNHALDSLIRQLSDAGVALTAVSYPAGRHGFDILDSTATTVRIVEQTLDFMTAVTQSGFPHSVRAAVPEVRAATAFSSGRWSEAEQRYQALATANPRNRTVFWRLGLSQLENRNPGGALASFTRARELGQGGARDIGVPAVRAAIRAGNTDAAVTWTVWALQSFPRVRTLFASDAELAPMLEHPGVRDALARAGRP